MDYRVLGPVEVLAGRETLRLGAPRQQAVLAVLALRAGEVVPTGTIVEAVWADDQPASATGLVRTYVSRLRLMLSSPHGGQTDLRTRSSGYVLEVAPSQVDAHRFEQLAGQGRRELEAGRFPTALTALERALALWRGEMLPDVATLPYFQPIVARLEEGRLTAVEDRLDAELALGRHVEVVGELQALTSQHPYRERIWNQLIVALYRSARQADALAAYRTVRSILVEEMGIDPSPELQRLERDVLGQARELQWPPPTTTHSHGAQRLMPSTGESIPLPAALAESLDSGVFVGRGREAAVLRRALDGACAGRFSTVFVAGPLGIGKTSLVASFARDAHSTGATVVFGRADEDAAVPFQAVGEAIRHWVEHVPDDHIELLGRAAIEQLVKLVPAFGEREIGWSPVRSWLGHRDRHDVLDAIVRWVTVLAKRRPAVLVLEDVHWADRATLLTVRHVIRHPPTAGAVMVVTHRDPEVDIEQGLLDVLADVRAGGLVQRIDLTGFTPHEVLDVLQAEGRRPSGSTGQDFAAQLCLRTGGNPLFIQETLQHLAGRGESWSESCGGAVERGVERFGVPPGVRRLVEQRLRRLPAATSAVLRQGAVVGRCFDAAIVSQMTAQDDLSVLEWLEPGVRAGLVEQIGVDHGRFAFPSSLVRDAILAGAPLGEFVRSHRRVDANTRVSR